jgi:glutamyl-tRNA reductase
MDDLKAFVDAGMAERRKEIGAVNQIIGDEVGRFVDMSAEREVAPLVASLHQKADELRDAELERFRVRLAGLDDRQRGAVEAVTRGVLAKLLHDPTVALKEAAGTPRGKQLAEAARILFDL